MTYTVEFAESVREQLKELPAYQRVIAIDAIEKHLVYEPLSETRRKKNCFVQTLLLPGSCGLMIYGYFMRLSQKHQI